ncbi:MAG: alpha/beta hydrolase [Ramlibacter sp.]|nr:alpha/beta hydrolase [Ramlibacter sp.]
MYQPRRIPRSEFVPIRNLQYHVLVWGEPGPAKVPVVMVHGWMDVAASYQFVVDAFAQDHYVVAPDWRGFGLTQGPDADNYWFPDYLADLDFLIDHYSPGAPVHLVGHSMGGNIAMLYSGARPQRVRKLANLEGFGMPATQPAQAPQRYAAWMDQLKAFHRGELDLKRYDSVAGVAGRLMKTNKRLSQDKADWLAQHWARPDADGQWRVLGSPAHKIINAQLYRVDEVLEIYGAITAPVLNVESAEDNLAEWWKGKYTLAEYHERLKAVSYVCRTVLQDAGHMLHHDQPEKIATLLEEFFVTN